MCFWERFGYAFLFFLCCDGVWIGTNVYRGIYAPIVDTFGDKQWWWYMNAFGCWIASALYIAGHVYDNAATAFLEGAWLGSLVYLVFNLTTVIVAPTWRAPGKYPFTLPVLDTLWGTVLFGSASAVVSAVC